MPGQVNVQDIRGESNRVQGTGKSQGAGGIRRTEDRDQQVWAQKKDNAGLQALNGYLEQKTKGRTRGEDQKTAKGFAQALSTNWTEREKEQQQIRNDNQLMKTLQRNGVRPNNELLKRMAGRVQPVEGKRLDSADQLLESYWQKYLSQANQNSAAKREKMAGALATGYAYNPETGRYDKPLNYGTIATQGGYQQATDVDKFQRWDTANQLNNTLEEMKKSGKLGKLTGNAADMTNKQLNESAARWGLRIAANDAALAIREQTKDTPAQLIMPRMEGESEQDYQDRTHYGMMALMTQAGYGAFKRSDNGYDFAARSTVYDMFYGNGESGAYLWAIQDMTPEQKDALNARIDRAIDMAYELNRLNNENSYAENKLEEIKNVGANNVRTMNAQTAADETVASLLTADAIAAGAKAAQGEEPTTGTVYNPNYVPENDNTQYSGTGSILYPTYWWEKNKVTPLAPLPMAVPLLELVDGGWGTKADVDHVYSYINKGYTFDKYYEGRDPQVESNEGFFWHAEQMTDDEKAKFNALYNADKKDEAMAFVKGLEVSNNQRASRYKRLEEKEIAHVAPVSLSAATVGATLTQPAEMAANLVGRMFGDPRAADPNSEVYRYTRMKNLGRADVAEQINNEFLRTVYNSGMSAADCAVNVLVMKGAGFTGEALQWATLAIFSTEAFQSSMEQKLQETHGNWEASALWATVDATIETATEIFSIEALLADPSNFFTYILKACGSEASEEFVGSVMGPVIQEMVNRKNEWKVQAQEIWNNGGYYNQNNEWVEVDSFDQAQRIAAKNWMDEIWESTLSGALSVGPSLGRATAYHTYQNIQTNRMGAKINSQQNSTYQSNAGPRNQNVNTEMQTEEGRQDRLRVSNEMQKLLDQAKEMDPESKSAKLAAKIEANLAEGKNVKNSQAGKLFYTLMQEGRAKMDEQTKGVRREVINERLSETGMEEKETEYIGDLVARAHEEGMNSLNRSEQRDLKNSEQGMQVLNELDNKVQQEDVEERLKDTGMSQEEQQHIADIVTRAANEGIDSLSQDELKDLTNNPAGELVLDELREEVKETETARKVRERANEANEKIVSALTDISRSALAKNSRTSRTADSMTQEERSSVQTQMATEEEIRNAKGTQTNTARDVVIREENGQATYGQIERVENGKVYVKVNNETRALQLKDIGATDFATAAILREQTSKGEGIYSDRYINKLLSMQDSGKINNAGTFLQEALQIRAAAFAGTQMRSYTMPNDAASQLYNEARAEEQELRRKDAEGRNAGKNKMASITFQGTQYGTEEYKAKIKDLGLDQATIDQMDAVAGIAQRAGIDVTFRNNDEIESMLGESMKGQAQNVQGEESDSGIELNVEAVNARDEAAGPDNRRNMVVTFGHEMTHWLQRNTTEGYNRLTSYVMSELQNRGQNVSRMIMDKIAEYAESGVKLDMHGAISEIVADACDQILLDEKVQQHIEESRPGLAKQIRSFVQDLVSRVKKAMRGEHFIQTSRESAQLLRSINDLAKVWLGAYDEAISGQLQEIQERTEPTVRRSMAVNETISEAVEEMRGTETFTKLENVLQETGEVAAMPARYSFAGVKASAAYAMDVKLAMQMEQDGYSRREIMEETGCVPGFRNTGRWWKVIDNGSVSTEKMQGMQAEQLYRLADVFDASDLYRAYPQLENTGVIFNDEMAKHNAYAAYDEGGMILLNPVLREMDQGFVSQVIRHEVQHAIQHIEGSNNGSSTIAWQQMQYIAEARMIANDQAIQEICDDYNIDAIADLDNRWMFRADGSLDRSEYTAEEWRKLKNIDAEELSAIRELVEDSSDWSDIVDMDPGYLYWNTVGEIEARAAEGTVEEQMKGIRYNNAVAIEEYSERSKRAARYSVAKMSQQYDQAVKEGDTALQQKIVDETARRTGYKIRAYHGTGRADRVGNVFLAERATSGPMAFFTDNRQIAENYARDKKDTSLAYDERYESYYTQFRTKTKSGKDIKVGDLWKTLSFEERQKITEAAKHITLDDEAGEIIYDENTRYGLGNFNDYERKLHGWNSIDTLIDSWLESGTLWNEEGRFLKVLELAGIKNVEYLDPEARQEKVYDTYLKIQNPFNTAEMYTNEFLDGLKAWWEKQDQAKYTKETASADLWDKNNITVDEWIEDAYRDIEQGTTHSWTRIPDGVTAYLKELGHDGIQDQGGKGGGMGHTVWIPFSSEQIKSADPVTYDDNGKVIPLSERFNQGKVDIRYKIAERNYRFEKDFENNINLFVKDQNAFVNKFGREELVIGPTFDILQDIGIDNKPMTIDQKHLEQALSKTNYKDLDHKMTTKDMMEIIKKANNPVAIIKSKAKGYENNSVVIIVDHKINGNIVIVPIRVSTEANYNKVQIDTNKMASAYGKQKLLELLNDAIMTELSKKTPGIYYTNKNKADFLRRDGVQFPMQSKNNGLMHKITDNPNFVKQKNKNAIETAKVMGNLSIAQSVNSNYAISESQMDVNSWMMGLSESSLRTESERQLLRAYKDLKMKIKISDQRLRDYNEKLRSLERKGEALTFEERDDVRALRNKIETQTAKNERLVEELSQVTSSEGYASMMYEANNFLQENIYGKSQEEVDAAVSRMAQEIQKSKENIAKRRQALEALGEMDPVKKMREKMKQTQIKKAAGIILKELDSTMNRNYLADRLAELSLQAANGEDIHEDVTALAQDLIDKTRGERSQELDDMRGETFLISPELAQELKEQHSSIRELQSKLKGSGIKLRVEEGGKFWEQWDEYRERNHGLPDLSENYHPIDQLYAMVDFIEQHAKPVVMERPEMDMAYVLVDSWARMVATQVIDEPTAAQKVKYLTEMITDVRKAHQTTVEEMRKVQEEMEYLLHDALETRKATGMLRHDVGEAIKYFNETSRIAAQVERQKVKETIIDQLKSENTRKLIQQEEEFRKRLKNDRRARELQADNEALRSKTNTVFKRVRNLLVNETDRKNIPEEAKPLARMLTGMIVNHDLGGNRKVSFIEKKQLLEFQRQLSKMEANNGAFDADTDLEWLVIGEGEGRDTFVRDKVMQDLVNIETGLLKYTTAEGHGNVTLQDRKAALEMVQEAVSEIWSVIQARQNAFIQGKRVQVNELAVQTEKDMENSRFKGERTGKTGKVRGKAVTLLNYGNLTPEYFFKNLKNKTLSQLYDQFHKAENRWGLEIAKAQAAMAQIVEGSGYAGWDTGTRMDVKLSSGKVVRLNLGEMMSLYATWKRESQSDRVEETSHLLNGGFVINDQETKLGGKRQRVEMRPVRVNEADMGTIAGMLTDQQKDLVDSVVEYMSGELAELGNETSMEMFGVRKFEEKYYFPIKSWEGNLNRKEGQGITNSDTRNRGMQQGFSKRIKAGSNNALEIGDFMKTAANHIVGMINYNTTGQAVENLNRVLNAKLTYGDVEMLDSGEEQDNTYKRNVRAAFQENYGLQAYDYLKTFLNDINGGTVQDNRGQELYDMLLSMFKKNAVAGSLSVAAQQPLSYIRAGMQIHPKYLARALNPKYWKGSYQEMMEHSGVAVIKAIGKFDMNYGQSAKDWIMPEQKKSKGKAVMDWLSEKSTALPEKMDAMTWTRMWSAVKLEQQALHPEMDVKSDVFLDMVGERFNEVMRRTQVYDSVLVKSQLMRSNNVMAKTLTSFMGEPTLTLNVLEDALTNIHEKGGKANAAKAVVSFVASALAQAAVKGLFGAGRNPDDKKNREENFLNWFGKNLFSELNPLSLIPGYGDMIELLEKGELKDDAYGMIGKAIEIKDKVMGYITGKEEGFLSWRGIEDTVGQFVQLISNVPAKNIMRDVRAMGNFFSNGALQSVTGGSYAQRETSSAVVKYQTLDTLMGNDMIGLINKYLKDAGYGYDTSTTGYYKRLWGAKKSKDAGKTDEITEYLTKGKGLKEKTVQEGVRTQIKEDKELTAGEKVDALKGEGLNNATNYIMTEYKEGRITREEALRLYTQESTAPEKEVRMTFQRVDYQMEHEDEEVRNTPYFRLYMAIDGDRNVTYESAKKELLLAGYTQEDIDEQSRNYILGLYKDKKLSKEKTKRMLKMYRRDMTDDDVFWTMDLIDYKEETGDKAASGYYYRLHAAIDAGKSNGIKSAVETAMKHGRTPEQIQSGISNKYKSVYLAASGDKKIRLKSALIMAFKATGMSEAEANKRINGWKPKKN